MASTPDDARGRRLSTRDAAARAGVGRSTWRDYTTPKATRGGRLIGPAPDGHEEISGYPYWYEATVDTWRANRPGQGTRTDLTATNPPAETAP